MAGMHVDLLRQICSRSQEHSTIKIFVETGTADGTTSLLARAFFPEVHTIELSKELYEEAKERLSWAGIHVHFGDSPVVLQDFVQREEPIFFYLDAHACAGYQGKTHKGPLPLWKELDVLKRRHAKDIILIDDVHCFEKDWKDVSWEGILDYVGKERVKKAGIFFDSFVLYL